MVTFRSIPLFSAIVSVFLMMAVPASGQEFSSDIINDIVLLKAAPVADDTASNQHGPLEPENEVSDVRILSRSLIRLYQKFVSSQQHNVCVFTPSCSHFGMESVERFGFVKGVLLTADRLTRCNTFVSQGGYGFDPVTGKFIDSIAIYCTDSTMTVPRATFCGKLLP